MTSLLEKNEVDVDTTPARRTDEFEVVESERSLGRNTPQRVGAKLWAPMLAMAVMAFAVGLGLGIYRSSLIAGGDPAQAATIASLQHVTAGVLFIGFLAVFSAIVFAIARILGEFRAGGGTVQETAGARVQTLKMPKTGRVMLVSMMLGMMLLVAAIIAHFVVAAGVTGAEADLLRSEQWFHALEGVRRIGVAIYLLGIAFGLATIIHVLRFQSVRVRELAAEVAERRG